MSLLILWPFGAMAESVVAGLSQESIQINANFDGSEILIYGAVKRDAPLPGDSRLDVIITVEGPSSAVTVRRKSRQMGIWVNTEAVIVESAPSFYAVESTAPLSVILTPAVDLRNRISTPLAIRQVGVPPPVKAVRDFSDALIRIREAGASYQVDEEGVRIAEDTLFRADVGLPANLIEGTYKTRIFLLRDRAVISVYEAAIEVRKVGLERWLYALAHEQPLIYGLLSLVLAVSAGWLASAAFRYVRN